MIISSRVSAIGEGLLPITVSVPMITSATNPMATNVLNTSNPSCIFKLSFETDSTPAVDLTSLVLNPHAETKIRVHSTKTKMVRVSPCRSSVIS